ncbi:hypothetical protein CGRA01v4_04542 [Colletotrichum graminicola]|uniref:Reverse transcriptase domain-containing protein n=1 Tax=Colletotrichum graminicola (strain M1.001 / M2 / FGSC 10212) TaxID=645133 RepID=E3Q8T9_COLGM|nr:uncharacterized protein GLRG_01948 [Colletotrichum graminicola M1.001]EFQ27453.1 hypothetical protein GLRG_01948 [Colletotrichum graminicola M1.001]WDK13261.1 hypothetical protein CGRA01v4_04542 [Colletotrichum graminicola]
MDKLKVADKAYPTRHPVPISSPVFVVAKDGKLDEHNGRMVMDIRPVNINAITDFYPMKTMDNIIAKAADATHISTFDAMAFFYQWKVHPSQWAFTVTTEGQYTFRVPIMGYKNSIPYVQRQMDSTLRGTAADGYCHDDEGVI